MPFATKLPSPVATSPAALPTARSLLKTSIANHAKSLGFDLVGVSPPKIEKKYLDALDSWLKKGCAADMQYMKDPEKILARSDLSKVLPGVKSVIVLGVNYYYHQPPLKRGYGRIARYAAGRDYHKVIGKMLKKLVKFLEQIQPDKNHRHKAYVDTGPLLERALAEQSGIGQIGKNGLVISREFGSWIFLAEILTTIDLGVSSDTTEPPSSAPLPADTPAQTAAFSHVPGDASARPVLATSHSASSAPTFTISGDVLPAPASSSSTPPPTFATPSSAPPSSTASTSVSPLRQKPFGLCGQCTKCITACPTGAIIAPGVIDSRLCISYLTIENRKKIPAHLAKKIKKTRRLFGCDICQEVCPHNEAKQKPVPGDVFAPLPTPTSASSSPSRNLSKPVPGDASFATPPASSSTSPPLHITTSAPVVPDDAPPSLSNTPPQPAKLTTHDSQNPQPLDQLPLKKILGIKSEQKFRIYFSSTALMRTKLKGLKRNARAIKKTRAIKG